MKEETHINQEGKRTLIEGNYPLLLTRALAEKMTGMEGQYLDRLRKLKLVRVYKTVGGHYRFHRDSLINHIQSNLEYGN